MILVLCESLCYFCPFNLDPSLHSLCVFSIHLLLPFLYQFCSKKILMMAGPLSRLTSLLLPPLAYLNTILSLQFFVLALLWCALTISLFWLELLLKLLPFFYTQIHHFTICVSSVLTLYSSSFIKYSSSVNFVIAWTNPPATFSRRNSLFVRLLHWSSVVLPISNVFLNETVDEGSNKVILNFFFS